MYSEKRNILELAALLLRYGITDVVLCPGSRNAPIVETLAAHPAFRCHPVTDERSAGFFALGLALDGGRPAAVCCTSGSALLNLHPAVAEAFYQQVPLVVISADRPRVWIGQMDGQTLPQPGVFGGLVRYAADLPEVGDEESAWYCNRVINEALAACRRGGGGPVQINVPISEPLFRLTEESLPEVRVIAHHDGMDEELRRRLAVARRPMVIVGQCPEGRLEGIDPRWKDRMVWLAEHPANFGWGAACSRFDTLLYALGHEGEEACAPDLVITLGGHIVSKRLKTFLRNHPPREHWHLTFAEQGADLFRALTAVVHASPRDFFAGADPLETNPDGAFVALWRDGVARIPKPEFGYSEMECIGRIVEHLPRGSRLHLGNSSVVRYAQHYDLPEGVGVCCNRGVSGIEGVLSTAVGCASAGHRLDFVVIGDLSFFYDMNALWNDSLGPNLRIVLLNNGGGEIFHALPGLEQRASTGRYVVAEHRTSARAWALERGLDYMAVEGAETLAEAVARITSPTPGPRPLLLEIFTRKEEDVRLLRAYYHQLK